MNCVTFKCARPLLLLVPLSFIFPQILIDSLTFQFLQKFNFNWLSIVSNQRDLVQAPLYTTTTTLPLQGSCAFSTSIVNCDPMTKLSSNKSLCGTNSNENLLFSTLYSNTTTTTMMTWRKKYLSVNWIKSLYVAIFLLAKSMGLPCKISTQPQFACSINRKRQHKTRIKNTNIRLWDDNGAPLKETFRIIQKSISFLIKYFKRFLNWISEYRA